MVGNTKLDLDWHFDRIPMAHLRYMEGIPRSANNWRPLMALSKVSEHGLALLRCKSNRRYVPVMLEEFMI